MSSERPYFASCVRVPDLRSIVGASGNDAFTVFGECDGGDIASMSHEGVEHVSGGGIPDLCSVVDASGNDELTVCGEGDGGDVMCMSLEGPEYFSCVRVPYLRVGVG